MAYDINDLFNKSIPEAIELPDLGGSALENITPNDLGTGEQGNNILNFGVSQAFIVVKVGDDIQKAIDKLHILGGGRVLLLNGTHIVDYDIVLYSSITLEGENSETAIIDFNSSSKQIKAVGTSAYTTGTVSVSNNSTTVTGSGTSWATNAVAGQSILLGGVWYPIAVVTDNTHITIGVPFADVALSGETYTIATVVNDTKLVNFVVKNSAISGVKLQYANEFVLDNLNVQTCLVGVDLDTCSQVVLSNIDCTANYSNYSFVNTHFLTMFGSSSVDALTGNGITLNKFTNSAIGTMFVLNSAGDGVNITSSSNFRIDGVYVENGGQGIEFVSGNSNVVVTDLRIESNASDGIKLTASSDNIFINNGFLKNNGGYGVNIADSSSDNAVIVGNNFSGNSSGALNDSGTSTLIRGNVGVDDNSPTTQFVAGQTITAGNAVTALNYSSDVAAFDTSASGSGTNNSSFSTSFTVANNSNRVLIIALSTRDATDKINAVSYNGVAMTKLVEATFGGSVNNLNQIWYLYAPATGAHTVQFTASGVIDNLDYNIYSWYNMLQSGATSNSATGGGGTATASLASTKNGALFIGVVDGATQSGSAFTNRVLTTGTTLISGDSGAIYPPSTQTASISGSGNVCALIGCFPCAETSFTTRVYKSSALLAVNVNSYVGIANESSTVGNNIKVVVTGIDSHQSGLTVGTNYYLSDTSGAFSSSAGTVTKKAGLAISATQMLVTNIW